MIGPVEAAGVQQCGAHGGVEGGDRSGPSNSAPLTWGTCEVLSSGPSLTSGARNWRRALGIGQREVILFVFVFRHNIGVRVLSKAAPAVILHPCSSGAPRYQNAATWNSYRLVGELERSGDRVASTPCSTSSASRSNSRRHWPVLCARIQRCSSVGRGAAVLSARCGAGCAPRASGELPAELAARTQAARPVWQRIGWIEEKSARSGRTTSSMSSPR